MTIVELGGHIESEYGAASMREYWRLVVVSCGLLTFGGYCLVQSQIVQHEAERLPRMTCDELTQNGPGRSRYVVLTDACLSQRRSVSQRDSETGHLELYHPFHAAHLQQEPAPRDLILILCIMDESERRRIRDEGDRRKRLGLTGLGELTGEVTQGSGQLQPWVRAGLAANYPGIQLANAWVVTVGRHEPTLRRARRLRWYGISSAVAAGALALGWRAWRRVATKRGKAMAGRQ